MLHAVPIGITHVLHMLHMLRVVVPLHHVALPHRIWHLSAHGALQLIVRHVVHVSAAEKGTA